MSEQAFSLDSNFRIRIFKFLKFRFFKTHYHSSDHLKFLKDKGAQTNKGDRFTSLVANFGRQSS